jgi:hypothetical protein
MAIDPSPGVDAAPARPCSQVKRHAGAGLPFTSSTRQSKPAANAIRARWSRLLADRLSMVVYGDRCCDGGAAGTHADGFPAEDQGGLFTPITLPVGAMQSRTLEAAKQVEKFYLEDEKSNVHSVFIVAGFSFAGQGQNTGQAFVNLTDWDERPGEDNSAQAIVGPP